MNMIRRYLPKSCLGCFRLHLPFQSAAMPDIKETGRTSRPIIGNRVHNFGAGPSILPREVYEEASQALLDFNNTGLSILEIGHRTKIFGAVIQEAISTLKELMSLDSAHEVLFLHGGASTQFFQVPMNLLDDKGTAAY